MEIAINSQPLYFNLFYFLAFAFLALAIIVKGRKHGYPYSSLLLLLGTITLAIILGSRLATIPLGMWPDLLFENETTYLNRSAIGGLILGLVALIVAQKALRLSDRFIIHFTWITPIGLAIQKLGCFINGCCFGKVTSNFLGVHYPQDTIAHINHWNLGYISDPGMTSLPVYPVQLFEVLGYVVVAIVAWQLRKKYRYAWSALWFGLSLIFATRFGLEFLRDPIGSQFSVETILGLRSIHWMILFMAVLTLVMGILQERKIGLQNKAPHLSKLQLFLVVSMSTILFHGLFMAFEWAVLWFTLLPALGIFTYEYLVMKKTIQKWGWAFIALAIPMVVIAQTVDTLKVKMEKFNEVSVGVNTGDFYNALLYNPVTGTNICGGTTTGYTKEPFKHKYSAYGAGYSRVSRNDLKSTRWGVYGYYGTIDSRALTLGDTYSNSFWGFSPYIQHDLRWWGLGAGIHAGQYYVNTEDEIESSDFENAIEKRTIKPSFYLRFGPRKYVDVIYRYGDLFPSPYPTTYQQLSIGTGLLQTHDYGLRFGKFFPGGEFISAEGVIKDRFGVKLMYIIKDDVNIDLSGGEESKGSKWVINLSYRFGGDLKN
jgi:phosphatidylglycerol:prolipoprotein diacylglycerol transferase